MTLLLLALDCTWRQWSLWWRDGTLFLLHSHRRYWAWHANAHTQNPPPFSHPSPPSSSSSSSFEFLFQDAFGSLLSESCAADCLLHQLLVHLCFTSQESEKQEASSYSLVQWAGDNLSRFYPQRKFTLVSFKVVEVWRDSDPQWVSSIKGDSPFKDLTLVSCSALLSHNIAVSL